MNKLLAYFHQLASPDTTDNIPRTDYRRLIILNKVHLIGIIICLTYGFLFLYLNITLFMLSSFFNAILSYSVFHFGKRTKVNITKWLSLLVGITQITFYGIILNVNAGIGLMLFYLLTLVFYIFDSKSSIYISLGILFTSCLLLSFSGLFNWQYHFLDASTSAKILPLSIISSFLMVTIILAIIRNDKIELDKELITNNNILQLNNQILVESNTINKRLLSVISHDLRSPMASLQGLLQLFSEQSIDLHEQQHLLANLSDRTKNINQLIEDILLWTSQQEKNRKAVFQKVSIQKELENITSLYSHEIRNKKLTVVKNIIEDTELITDRNILAFSLRNVLSNAIKYSPEGASVIVQAKVLRDLAIIDVVNKGSIDERIANSLFQQQVESKKGSMNEKGFGLGLYLSSLYLTSIDSTIEMKQTNNDSVSIEINIKNHPLY